MPSRRTAPLAPVLVAALVTAACTSPAAPGPPSDPSVGLATPDTVSSYNTRSAGAATSVLGRVQPGLFYLGPDGVPLADTDLGTVTGSSADPLVLTVTLDPRAVFSDGVALDCDDVLLAWVGGRSVPGDGWADVTDVACADGERTATVTFAAGRARQEWPALLGAGSLLPAHVAEQRSGVTDLVAAVRAGDTAALAAVLDFWRTGWVLTPGILDTTLLPSAGPYRVDSLGEDGVLVLRANPAWWGDAPLTPRVDVHTGVTDPTTLLAAGTVQAAEGGTALDAVPGTTVTTTPGFAVEQLVLDARGALADPALRRTFAQCVPRQDLAEAEDTDVLASHTTVPGDVVHVAVTAAAPDLGPAAAGAGPGTEVRLGYRAPDPARAATLEAITEACAAAGVVVVDASGPGVGPGDLAVQGLDALLDAPAGSLLRGPRLAALRTGSPTNPGAYSSPAVDQAVDAVVVAAAPEEQAALLIALEAVLWTDLPVLPLHRQSRTTVLADALVGAVPNPTAAGLGWNLDRWVLTG